MATPFDPDQLLALALTQVQGRHRRGVRTHEEILAAARATRAEAIEIREKLRVTRAGSAAALARATDLQARLGT